MTHPDDDTRDLIIHSRIESALRMLCGGRRLARPDALQALKACALGQASPQYEHMIIAIIEGMALSREDLSERIQAVIELDEEERQERIAREALAKEAAA